MLEGTSTETEPRACPSSLPRLSAPLPSPGPPCGAPGAAVGSPLVPAGCRRYLCGAASGRAAASSGRSSGSSGAAGGILGRGQRSSDARSAPRPAEEEQPSAALRPRGRAGQGRAALPLWLEPPPFPPGPLPGGPRGAARSPQRRALGTRLSPSSGGTLRRAGPSVNERTVTAET